MKRRYLIFNGFIVGFFALSLGISSVLLALDPDKAITQYCVQAWNMETGLPGNSVFTIRQTQDGYLWLGTKNGLVRFDGLNFELYDKRKIAQLLDNDIRALYEDRKGTLWIGTNSGGLTRYREGEFTTYPVKKHQALIEIRAIEKDRWGNLWIGSFKKGLTCLSSGQFTTYTTNHGLPHDQVRAIYKDGNGDLWVTTAGGIVKLLKPGIFSVHRSRDLLPQKKIKTVCLYEAETESLWIGTGGSGLFRFDNGILTPYGIEAGIPNQTINYLYRGSKKNLWIGTDGGGLTRMSNGVLSTLHGCEDRLVSGRVYSIYEDRESSLWVGTVDGGLHQLRDGKFTTYTTREGLAHDDIHCIHEDRAGNLWIGTKGGLNRLRKGRVTTELTTETGLLDNRVVCLLDDIDGSLWIGTWSGLHRFKDGKLIYLTKKDGISDNRIICILIDRQGDTWIGTQNGLNRFNYTSGKITVFTTKEGLLSNLIRFLFEDSRGNLLIGTNNGLNCLREGVITVNNLAAGLKDSVFRCAHEDKEGALWLGTDRGLIRLKGGKKNLYTLQCGLVESDVYSILEDDRGYLWLAGPNGISRISKKELEDFSLGKIPEVHPDWFNEMDGMKSRWCTNVGCETRDGKFWFPTSLGVAMIDPNNIKSNHLDPPVIIEKLVVDGKTVNINGKPGGMKPMELGPGIKRLEFYYTAVSFINPQRIQFKLKLVGFDNDWVNIGTSRNTNYTGIPPGHYTFHVIACNADGVFNQKGDSFSFYLKPYFYQALWFYLLVAIFVLLVVLIGHRRRVKKRTAREEKLQLVVEERTKDLKEAKEIAEKANRAKSEFLSHMSHDIRTPLNAILGFADILYHELKDKRQSEYLSAIRSSGKTLLGLIEDVLDLSRIEAGKLEIEYTPVDLKTLFKEIQSIFITKLEEKRLDFKMEISAGFPEILMLDETRIRQTLFNLVGNAIKFTHSGYIKISASSFPPENKKENDGKHVDVRFSVEDTGIGIPGDQLDSIFGAFIQREGQSHVVYGGSGLGLAITHRLVELMGGTISVTSKEGHGSTFQVCIKGVEKASYNDFLKTARKDAGIDIDAVVFKKARILIVDDLRQNRDLLKAYLIDYPELELLEAGGGEEAVELTRNLHPDVILMDMVMPGLDGFQASKMIKSDETLKNIPVIAVTASVMKPEEIKYKKICDDLLKKPLNKIALILKLMQFLDYSVSPSEHPASSYKYSRESLESVFHVEDPEKLTRLVTILQTQMQPWWQEISKTFTINDIEDFGKEAKKIGTANGCQLLADWGQRLENQAAMFDMDLLPGTLKQFSFILNQLKNLMDSKGNE